MDALILTVILTSIPLILAATGELIAERSGVLNLGVEGMMLMGAVAAFAITSLSGNPYFGIIACLLYTSPSPRDATLSRMPSSA